MLWCGSGRLSAGELRRCEKDCAGALKRAINDYSTGETDIIASACNF
jgi:hypothetical protein